MWHEIGTEISITNKISNMKNKIFFAALMLLLTISVFADAKAPLTKASFKVTGNCESCKIRIEKAAKVEGVKKANWDESSNILTVTFNPLKITVDQIEQNVAKVGHDTEKYKAEDSIYNNLPDCCHYDRKK
jgi:copper chaperone CopZ